MMKLEQIKVQGKTKEEALTKAIEVFEEKLGQGVDSDQISIDLLESKKKLFGLIKVDNLYQVSLEIEETERVDGDFSLKVRDEGIFLKVKQPEGHGREVKMDMIEEILEEKEIVEVDYAAVSEALTLDEEVIKIAERMPELDRESEVEIRVSKDKMKAYLSYIPPLGKNHRKAVEIVKRVKAEGVIFGLRDEELEDVYDPEEPLENFLIAVGQEPVPGKNGRVEFEFDINSQDKKVNILEDGNADFKNLNRIVNVKPGDILATKVLAVPGEVGYNVFNEEVPPKAVKEVELPVGQNVSLSEDEMSLESEIEGQAVYTKNSISVLQVYTVKGDVDLSTGNIDFSGSVEIQGNVTDGMEVSAKGNVLVKGSVHGAKIKSDGQTVIKKGFIGSNKGKIESKGDVEVKFVENATIITKGNLIFNGAVMHSFVDAGEKVIGTSGKGLIVGGKIRATVEIDAKIIGSALATSTEVAVGLTPEIRDKYREKNNKFKEGQDKLDQIIKNIKLLKQQRQANNGKLLPQKQDLLNQLIRSKFSLVAQIEELKKERRGLATKIEEGAEGKIKVQDRVHSGVVLTIGTIIKRITEEESHLQYYSNDDEIKSKPYA